MSDDMKRNANVWVTIFSGKRSINVLELDAMERGNCSDSDRSHLILKVEANTTHNMK